MSETRDPAIKLFGRTISLPGNKEIPALHGNRSRASANEESFDETSDSPSTDLKENNSKGGGGGEQTEEKESFHRIPTETKEKDGAPPLISEELTDRATFTRNKENTKTPLVEIEIAKINASMTEEAQIDVGDAQEKTTLKKPDKLLPCPRCNSMDTKFCYFNNYNVNQPRHFCKNCQRYWTAGGTMRNMAVGAGRRKNKNSASHYRHIIVSESLQTAQTTAPDGIHHPALKPKGTILTFGSDAPPCESMASALNLADKTTQNCTQNGVRRGGEVAEDKSKGSYVTASSSMEEGRGVGLPKQMMQNCHGFPPQIPFFPGPPPWSNPWNTHQWSSAVAPPGFCPTFPIPFYPTPTYWGSPVPGPWSVPWLPPPSSAPNYGGLASTSASGPNSPTLGKHSREGDMLKPSISENKDPLKQSNSETSIWIPKTLRIDDPSEAAKSSIWATLGIKRDKSDSSSSGGLLRPFESSSKGDEKNHTEETSKVLQANPAALSRSLNFRERW